MFCLFLLLLLYLHYLDAGGQFKALAFFFFFPVFHVLYICNDNFVFYSHTLPMLLLKARVTSVNLCALFSLFLLHFCFSELINCKFCSVQQLWPVTSAWSSMIGLFFSKLVLRANSPVVRFSWSRYHQLQSHRSKYLE